MSKAILFGRECTEHPSNTIIFVCLSKDCQKNRLICNVCLETHNNHKEILDSDKFDELLEKVENGNESLNIKFDHMLEDLRADFEKIIQKMSERYNLSIKKMKIMNIKTLNKYFEQLIRFYREKENLEDQLEEYFSEFKENLSECEIELQTKNNQVSQAIKEKAKRLFDRGQYLYEQEYYVKALNLFDQSLGVQKNQFNSLTYKGNTLIKLNKLEESIQQFDRILLIDPKYTCAWTQKGDCLRMMGQYENSIEAYRKALEIYPSYIQAQFGLAQSLQQINQYTEPIKHYNLILEKEPFHIDALIGKGNSLYSLQRYQDALYCFEQVLNTTRNLFNK